MFLITLRVQPQHAHCSRAVQTPEKTIKVAFTIILNLKYVLQYKEHLFFPFLL